MKSHFYIFTSLRLLVGVESQRANTSLIITLTKFDKFALVITFFLYSTCPLTFLCNHIIYALAMPTFLWWTTTPSRIFPSTWCVLHSRSKMCKTNLWSFLDINGLVRNMPNICAKLLCNKNYAIQNTKCIERYIVM